MALSGPEAWEKAAACEAHARGTTDEKLQRRFRQLRDSWVRIANDAQFATNEIAKTRTPAAMTTSDPENATGMSG